MSSGSTSDKSAVTSSAVTSPTSPAPDISDRTGSIVFAVLAMLVATLTTIPAGDFVKERLADGDQPLLAILATVVSGIIVAAIFIFSVRTSGLGAAVVGAVLVIAGAAFLAVPGALMNIGPGGGYWHALASGSSWISLSGGFAAAGAALIGLGAGLHFRRRRATSGPPGTTIAGVLLAVAGALLVAYAGPGSAKPAVFLVSSKINSSQLYWKMLSEQHYVTLLVVLLIGLVLLAAAGYVARWSAWAPTIAGALLEIPVLLMVIRPSWIVSGAGKLLAGSDAGSNIGEFILFGGLGLIGIVLLGGGVGAMMLRAGTPPVADDAAGEPGQSDERDAAGEPGQSDERDAAGEPGQSDERDAAGERSAADAVGHEDPQGDVNEELGPRE